MYSLHTDKWSKSYLFSTLNPSSLNPRPALAIVSLDAYWQFFILALPSLSPRSTLGEPSASGLGVYFPFRTLFFKRILADHSTRSPLKNVREGSRHKPSHGPWFWLAVGDWIPSLIKSSLVMIAVQGRWRGLTYHAGATAADAARQSAPW